MPPESIPRAPERNDEPISSLSEEKLGYEAYAEVLADRILSAKPPVTIGIYGIWGSGKTSLMQLIKYKLVAKGPSMKTIWIDVWKLSTQEDVWHAFLQALVNQVRHDMRWWRRIRFKAAAKQLLRNGYRLLLVLIPALVGTYVGKPDAKWTDVFQLLLLKPPFQGAAPITGAVLSYGLAVWALREPIKAAWEFDVKAALLTGSYQARITELDRLSAQFADFVHAYVGDRGRLVVFIDDLDRCAPRAIPGVLDAIKLFAATDRCIYVVGLDPRAVGNAIKEGHSFSSEEDGVRYLEKIIQIPFQLPALSPAAVRFYLRELFPELDTIVAEVFALGMEANPRILKRAVQIYTTWMHLADRGLKRWEVDPLEPELVAKWLTIQLRYRQLSEFLSRRKDHLLWLERNALRQAAERGRLREEDARLLPEVAADPLDPDRPELDEAALNRLDALLVSGERRFNERLCRSSLDSYVYLGGAAGGLEGEIRARSQERSMLLSHDASERQKFVNQLVAVGGVGKYREFFNARDRTSAYSHRLQLAANERGVLTEDEKTVLPSAVQALAVGAEDLESTLYVPARQHVLGTPPEQLDLAMRDGLDAALAERERPRPMINIAGFRIGRFPVTNDQYRTFVNANQKPDEATPFSVVEYQAYCEPAFEAQWDSTPQNRETRIELPDSAESLWCVHLDVKSDGLSARLISSQVIRPTETVMIPLRWRKSGVLTAEGLIVLLTIGDAWNVEDFGEAVPAGRFRVMIKVWRANRTISLRRAEDWPIEDGRWDHPVANVTWEDAVAYCVWLRLRTGKPFRLPMEPEWEAAATGDGFRKTMFPWGDRWNQGLANTSESSLGGTVPVRSRSPECDSPFSLADLVGNVWEWCADAYGEVRDTGESGLLWDDVRFRLDANAEKQLTRAVRGGSFRESKAFARNTCRCSFEPSHVSPSVGFRVAMAAELEGLVSA